MKYLHDYVAPVDQCVRGSVELCQAKGFDALDVIKFSIPSSICFAYFCVVGGIAFEYLRYRYGRLKWFGIGVSESAVADRCRVLVAV